MSPRMDSLKRRAAEAWQHTLAALRAAARVLLVVLRRGLEIALALIVLFEEWGWRPLADLLAGLGRWWPLARLERTIADLPPHAALAVFALPTALFFPLKLLAFYLIAKGQAAVATGVFALAKVLGTALVARIFQLTRPALMRISWFAWGYRPVRAVEGCVVRPHSRDLGVALRPHSQGAGEEGGCCGLDTAQAALRALAQGCLVWRRPPRLTQPAGGYAR